MPSLQRRTKLSLIVSWQVAWCWSCSTVTYDGPRRSSDQVANLAATDGAGLSDCKTDIATIDGKTVHGSRFEILPGRHRVQVTSKSKGGGNNGAVAAAVMFGVVGAVVATSAASPGPAVTYDPLTVCFTARPGHSYEVRTSSENDMWEIEVIDQESASDVKAPCQTAPKPSIGPTVTSPPRPVTPS